MYDENEEVRLNREARLRSESENRKAETEEARLRENENQRRERLRSESENRERSESEKQNKEFASGRELYREPGTRVVADNAENRERIRQGLNPLETEHVDEFQVEPFKVRMATRIERIGDPNLRRVIRDIFYGDVDENPNNRD